jgi:phosphate transport system substrate-binding protein
MRAVLLALLLLAACSRAAPGGPEPHQIRLVGASAALPFTAAVAEDFMRAQADAIAPLVQAGGSAAGIARFCGGLGAHHPDLVAATRPMTPAEQARCAAGGVTRIATVQFGWSALVLVVRRDAVMPGLTRADLWRVLTGGALSWADVRAGLPQAAIQVDGPTPRPALADGLFEALLVPGCRAAAGTCGNAAVRRDGTYRGHGADTDLVADTVETAPPGAVGIVTYADAVRHADTLRMLALDGVTPDAGTIATGRYPARLPLVLMVKAGEAPAVPGMPTLLARFAQALAPDGRFAALGLVPLAPDARRAAIARIGAVAAAQL